MSAWFSRPPCILVNTRRRAPIGLFLFFDGASLSSVPTSSSGFSGEQGDTGSGEKATGSRTAAATGSMGELPLEIELEKERGTTSDFNEDDEEVRSVFPDSWEPAWQYLYMRGRFFRWSSTAAVQSDGEDFMSFYKRGVQISNACFLRYFIHCCSPIMYCKCELSNSRCGQGILIRSRSWNRIISTL
ncbi:hypothetical protein CVT26_001921 [Gymnopilus dilepis]|uniref:Uncharacterized protein n=1 Tax=Gymnopilus dilepis TaxID=231916 RepID=A0A409Y463_9AGAR|nr:hypothetical protein CVT26_001921 [Gymnopilus dilepis]